MRIVLISVWTTIFFIGCRHDSSPDTSLFSVEVVAGVRSVHNFSPQLGNTPGVKLELIGKIGSQDNEDEGKVLFDPVDAARLSNGDILILEGRGCAVKRYNKDHKYISSFGQKGQGPGDFQSPFLIKLNPDRNRIYVGDDKISMFFPDGKFEDGFIPPWIGGSSIKEQYRKSGLAALSGSRVILPSDPSRWRDSGKPELLSIYDKKGVRLGSFGAVRQYDNPDLTLNANIGFFTSDRNDYVYIAHAFQNKISKYSPDGTTIFSADRPLPYEIKNEVKAVVFKSGSIEREFPWPSVTSVAKGLSIDHKNRIWVLTFTKQPNKYGVFAEEENLTACYKFEVFDSSGILLFNVPFPNVRFDQFSIYDDRIYLIESTNEMCVYEYRMIERN